ncbi:MAG: BTAD domain-containing putative transcriptional regulator [Chloroflexota bacterium]
MVLAPMKAANDPITSGMISLLGTFQLTLAGQPVPISSGSKSELLLTQLALARRQPIQRDLLLDRLWPNYDATLASQSLNTLIYQINKLTKPLPESVTLVQHDNGYYTLNTSDGIGLDIDYFETWASMGQRLVEQGDLEQGIQYFDQALSLYRGDLVAVDDIQTLLERERLRTAYLNILATLADHHMSQDAKKALTYLHQLLQYDPCREDAHRLAMCCYVQLGTRAQALRQYQLCTHILATEFDIKPEPETEALYHQIRTNPESLL